MARDRASIRIDMWGDGDWRDLPIGAQLVGIFLIANYSRGPWPVARICRHTGWQRATVEMAIVELKGSKFTKYVQTEPRRRRMSQKVRRAVYERDGHVCLHCGSTEKLTVDHIFPVSRGGADDLSNLQTLCHSCNAKKGARI